MIFICFDTFKWVDVVLSLVSSLNSENVIGMEAVKT